MKLLRVLGSLACLALTATAADASSALKTMGSRVRALPCLASGEDVRVTLRVFSGSEDPHWTLRSEAASAVSRVSRQPHARSNVAAQQRLGYSGFVLHCAGQRDAAGVLVQGWPEMEKELLISGSAVLTHTIYQHVQEHLGQRISPDRVVEALEVVRRSKPARNSDDPCDSPPLVGPDTVPAFDPATDDLGCFVDQQSNNNCYAYGSDIVTNTFPQPGRGTGHKWTENTCEDMQASAIRDGYIFYSNSTEAPVGQPEQGGHYVTLLIWPDTNFHWVRLDNNTLWSHKPGGTAVTNHDNNGGTITNPALQDFSPWTQFCSFMIAIPSKLKIA